MNNKKNTHKGYLTLSREAYFVVLLFLFVVKKKKKKKLHSLPLTLFFNTTHGDTRQKQKWCGSKEPG